MLRGMFGKNFDANRFQKNLRTTLSNMLIFLHPLFLYMYSWKWQEKKFLVIKQVYQKCLWWKKQLIPPEVNSLWIEWKFSIKGGSL